MHVASELRLDLSARALSVSVGDHSATLALGWSRMDSFAWPGEPKAADIECAIDHIEDALQSVATWASAPESASLNADAFDKLVAPHTALLPVNGGTLTREVLESAFRTWAEAAQGSVTAGRVRFGATSQGDAILLLLREIAHHWDIPRLTRRANVES
ncbi:hypothetical protein NBRC116584_36090 [Hydrogenophaga sp. 5NK40-0174]